MRKTNAENQKAYRERLKAAAGELKMLKSKQEFITHFEARAEDGSIQIRVEAGAYIGYYTLSDMLIDEVIKQREVRA